VCLFAALRHKLQPMTMQCAALRARRRAEGGRTRFCRFFGAVPDASASSRCRCETKPNPTERSLSCVASRAMPGRDSAHGFWVYGVPVVLELAVGGDGSLACLAVLTYRPYLLLGLLLQPVAVHRVPCLRRKQTKGRGRATLQWCARAVRCTLHRASCILHLRLQCCTLYVACCMLLMRDRALRSSAVAGATTQACIHIGHSGSAAPRLPSLRDGRRRTSGRKPKLSAYAAQHQTAQRSTVQHSAAQRSTAQHSIAWFGLAWRRAARVDLVACSGRVLTFDLISSSSPSLMYLRAYCVALHKP
jgi:hypothetical protein